MLKSQYPRLSAVRFAVLSALIGGDELSKGEICAAIDWRTSSPNFWRITTAMVRAGLMTKSALKLQSGESEIRFAITRSGGESWQEFLDFAVFIAETHGSAKQPAATIPVVTRRPARCPRRPSTHRLMNAAEQERLFRSCNAALRRLVIASRELSRLSLEEITALSVRDFDIRTGEVVHGKHRLPVSRDLEREIREAIGNRKAGRLFLTPRGKRWTVNSAGTAFRRARIHADIAEEVVLRGAVFRRAS